VISPSSLKQWSNLRVAIVHYWFVGRAGGERVVEALAELFPQADLFSLVANRATLAPVLQNRKLHLSFLQNIPGATRFHRQFLLLQPIALEQFDLSEYDLVISSESGPAKGIITSPKTCHICYCHSPMRYIWDMYPHYKRTMPPLMGTIFSLVAHYMRLWDFASAGRVDYFVANSRFVASRIHKCYRRKSMVIYPPVETSAGSVQHPVGDYYLAVGRLVDYKRFDLAVSVCTKLGRRLRVIGGGPEYKALRKMAGPTVQFLGITSDDELRRNLASCRGLLFPGEEDFGIVPVEAHSFGRPVIAYASGGVLETVCGLFPGEILSRQSTGVFFTEQTAWHLTDAILRFEVLESDFDPKTIREHSLQFDRMRFKTQFSEFVQGALRHFQDYRIEETAKSSLNQ
jgi:glycosyltransferase involved in cell wall biosynthesis